MYMINRYLGLLILAVVSASVHAKQVTINHDLGQTTVQDNPERVVAIGVGIIDMLDHFGIEPVATSQDYLPDYLSKYTNPPYHSAGTLFEPDFENIYTVKPDVILIGPRIAAKYKELSEIAPTIVISPAESGSYWQSTKQQWRNLAQLFDIEEKVESEIALLNDEFKSIKQHNTANPAKALTVMSIGGNITAFSEKSRFASIYVDFGFLPSAEGLKPKRHGDAISFEFISQNNPEYLFVFDSDKLRNKLSSRTKDEFNNALVNGTKAYQNGHIKFVDMDAWYLSLGGVTATRRMISDVKDVLHESH